MCRRTGLDTIRRALHPSQDQNTGQFQRTTTVPSDGDDAHSLASVTSHELERVEKEDGGQLSSEEEEQRQRRDEPTHPRTPEPTGWYE